jgi:peroxiredoxin family protein
MKLYACSNTLQVLGISQDELTGKVDGVSGAAALLSMAENAQILCL